MNETTSTTTTDDATAVSPADLRRLPTESRNPRSLDLDQRDSLGVVELIGAEDEVAVRAVRAVAPQIAAAVDLAVATIAAGGAVHYVGAGTSGRLAVLDAAELVPTYNVDDDVVSAHLAGGQQAFLRAVEGAEDDTAAGAELVDGFEPGDLVVGLAASGRTPFVGGALRRARERGMGTALIAAHPQAPLAELADVAILLDTGPEVVTGSTRMKAGTAQKMVINSFSTATMVRSGRTYSNLMIEVLTTNRKLEARAVHMLQQATERSAEDCAEVLAKAVSARGRAVTEGPSAIKVALVALLADADIEAAEAACREFPADPTRAGDPSGVRTAVARLQG